MPSIFTKVVGIASLVLLLPYVAVASPLRRQAGYDSTCKELSLSNPSWYFWDPTVLIVQNSPTGRPFGDFGVGVYNTATDGNFECFIQNIDLAPLQSEEGWHECSIPGVQVRPDITTNTFALRQTWVCEDSPELKFVANGTVTIPTEGFCETAESDRGIIERCTYANRDIIPTLASPVNIRPYVPEQPWSPWEPSNTCPGRSAYPEWQIDDFAYAQKGKQESLQVNLTNLSNGGRIACSVDVNTRLTRENAYAETWHMCKPPSGSNPAFTGLQNTYIMFNLDYGLFAIKQSWQCVRQGEIFSGLAYHSSGFQCGKDGLKCSLPSTKLTGWWSEGIPPQLPHTSYVRSCMMNSMNGTELRLQSYGFRQTTTPNESRASFVIQNPGPGDIYHLENLLIQDDGKWHQCGLSPQQLPWQLKQCEYHLDRKAKSIGFRFQWLCDDRDPFHPVVFNATADGQYECDAAECQPPAGQNGIALKISALTWSSSDKPMDRGPQLPWV